MNYSHISFLFALIFLVGIQTSPAQQPVKPHSHHTAVEKIEQAYKKGDLTLNDKIRFHARALYQPARLPSKFRSGDSMPEKCGTPLRLEFFKNKDKLAKATISEVESLVNQSSHQNQETYTSSSGRFEINYDTTGDHSVPEADKNDNDIPDYVEWVAQAADSSWNHEIETLGYTDFILGPSQPYKVNIINLQSYYGETVASGNTTFIRVENDFLENFPPNTADDQQRGRVQATIAHEIKHASQYAATGWTGETDYWSEMDATLMEEVVYDDVNDYYNYIQTDDSIFLSPRDSFYPGSYYHVTWALFFEEKHGPDFWPQVWDRIIANPEITMVTVLSETLGSEEAFRRDYIESHLWHYASGEIYSREGYGFEESDAYPTPDVQPNNSIYNEDFSIPRLPSTPRLSEFSARYYEIQPQNDNTRNVAIEITSIEAFVGIGMIAYFQDGSVDTEIYTSPDDFEDTDWNWNNIQRLGLVFANSDTGSDSEPVMVEVGSSSFETVTLSQNYPNPFNPDTHIRFTLDQPSHVKLSIYDTAGRLIRTLYDQELEPGLYEPTFNGENLASGVYIYQLVTDEKTVVKKMTLIK